MSTDYQLKFSLEQAKEFKYLIDLCEILDEANFIASKRGIELRSLDPSRVAMVDLVLPAKCFENYSIVNNCRLGIKIDEMKQIMNRSKANDCLEAFLTKEGLFTLRFYDEIERLFSISLLALEENNFPEPNVATKAEVTIQVSTLQEALKDAAAVNGDYLQFHATKDKLAITASSETKALETIIEKDANFVQNFKVNENCQGTYSLFYLEKILKKMKPNELVKIVFSSQSPIVLSTNLLLHGEISFFLSPRIPV
ncbi:MAG: hypothetical protein ACTSYG_07260 [Candidatus Heimdallarchaeota archaeon]